MHNETSPDDFLSEALARFADAQAGLSPAANVIVGLRSVLLAISHPDLKNVPRSLIDRFNDVPLSVLVSLTDEMRDELDNCQIRSGLEMCQVLLSFAGSSIEELTMRGHRVLEFLDARDGTALLAAEIEVVCRRRQIKQRADYLRDYTRQQDAAPGPGSSRISQLH